MNRDELKILAQDFMQTYEYMRKDTNVEHGVIFSRPTGLGINDEWLVYFHENGEEGLIRSALTQLGKRFERITGGKQGRRIFLSPYPLGTVPPSIGENNFYYQIPAWFFDREFSARKKQTPLKKMEQDAKQYENERVGQPFTCGTHSGSDLLPHLMKDLRKPDEPLLRVIVAPAGYGKTVLMGTLYSKLTQDFTASKRAQEFGSRPVLMLPGHVQGAQELDVLIDNFINCEYDYGVLSRNAFKFWVKNNLVMWLFDGLEELIRTKPEEIIFSLLEDYIFSSESATTQIILAIRSPLLASSPELRIVLKEWEGTGLRIYNLSSWTKKEQEKYFLKNLSLDQEDVKSFIDDVRTSDTLQAICHVPYYCSVVTELRENNQMQIFRDECELIEHAVAKLCEREAAKGLDIDIVPVSTQVMLFSDIAEEVYSRNSITTEMLRMWIEIYLDELKGEVKRNQIDCLLRHALLTQTGENLDFIQDSIKHYFFGLFLFKRIKEDRIEVFDEREVEPHSLTAYYLAKNASQINWNHIFTHQIGKLTSSVNDDAIGFRNLMEILLSGAVSEKESLIMGMLHNKNLTGLTFKDLDLSDYDFRHSNLSDVNFINCNLARANFDGCHLKNTLFHSTCDIGRATMRGTVTDLIRTETKVLDSRKAIDKFMFEKTQIPIDKKTPCQAFINLRKILKKLRRKGKGYSLPKKFLLMVKCCGGVPADKCVEACIHNRIIIERDDSVKIKMDLFDDVEQFVNKLELTPSIRKALDEVCPDRNISCPHEYA